MRLINTADLSLKQVNDSDLECQNGNPPRYRYSILSHRWENEGEPTFEDFECKQYDVPQSSIRKVGVVKIEAFCDVARKHGFDWAWVDTCCIDKRSSTELQEAINTMFRFYELAGVCFVYLRDVVFDTLEGLVSQFVDSEWFSRGWTLQELLAPSDCRFYDRDWKFLGTKKTLSRLISTATGIQEDVLTGQRDLRECSVAQRMSWAANRVTTRLEDRSYSLLGLFDVNMPMLYGEGPKSFLRLQEEIIKSLDDHSLFAWKGLRHELPGMLAPSPKAFASFGDVQNLHERMGRRPYIVNNRGLHGLVPLIPYTLDTYVTLLPCVRHCLHGSPELIGIFLRRLYEDDQYMRVSVDGQDVMENASTWTIQHGVNRLCVSRSISVRQNPLLPRECEEINVKRVQGFRLSQELLLRNSEDEALFSISGEWNPENRIVSLSPGSRRLHHVGSVNIGPQAREVDTIRFGFDHDYNPIVYLTHKDVRYSEKEDHRGVFMENFTRASREEETYRQLQGQPSLGENFQSASLAVGGEWSRSTQIPDGTWVAAMSTSVEGFWALKGDRLDGLDVHVVKPVRRIGEPVKGRRVAHLRLRRVIVDECLFWDLHLDKLAPLEEQQHGEEAPRVGDSAVNASRVLKQQVMDPLSGSSTVIHALENELRQMTDRLDSLTYEYRHARDE